MKVKSLLVFLTAILVLRSASAQMHKTLFCAIDSINPNLSGYYIDGNLAEYGGACGSFDGAALVAIMDTLNCSPLDNTDKNFGQLNLYSSSSNIGVCRARPENFFIYKFNDSVAVRSLGHLLDSITDGNQILVYTYNSYAYSQLDTSFANSLTRLGSIMVSTLPDSVPFIFYCQKGNLLSVNEIHALSPHDSISLIATLNCFSTNIDNFSEEKIAFNIFPNPTLGLINVSFNRNLHEGEITIFNSIGEKAYSDFFFGKQKTITCTLSEGIYLVQIRDADGQYSQRLIVE